MVTDERLHCHVKQLAVGTNTHNNINENTALSKKHLS